MKETTLSVVVTGTAWMGSGIGSIESALERIFREARQEIILSIYSLTSGADVLFIWIESALNRGVEIRVVINRLNKQPEDIRIKLDYFCKSFPHFSLYSFSPPTEGADLHAKAIVADREMALVGSSNMSRRGFLVNHEIAILLSGSAANTIATAMDRLLDHPHVSQLK